MPVTAEEKLDYILTCLSHCVETKPDYHAVAAEKGIANANNAQKAFKKYIEESNKFKLVNGQIVATNGEGIPATPTEEASAKAPKTSKKRDARATTKKRKLDADV